MANPRKFSEKIALLCQKEAEGTAEFERIMREVSEVSSKVVAMHINRLFSSIRVPPKKVQSRDQAEQNVKRREGKKIIPN